MNASVAELKQYAGTCPLVPVYRAVKTDMRSPVDLVRRLRRYSSKLFVLEHTGSGEEET